MDDWMFAANEEFKPLSRILNSVRVHGAHFASGSLIVPMPRIEVDGAGVIPFPVPLQTCRKLVEKASRAPYGRGEETLIDTSVRNTWQIDPDHIRIGGSTWGETFHSILCHVTEELGFPEGNLSAEFYKLLVYERGGFFAPHRDTEKANGMVGTLVIALPVDGSGGELVIRHGDRENVINMRADEPADLQYAAFYADCVHEIRPVMEGHRIALVFNLIARSGSGRTAKALDHGREIRKAVAWLRRIKAAGPVFPSRLSEEHDDRHDSEPFDDAEPLKIVWPLQHSYSEAGLSFDNLKGLDRAHARILAEAAEMTGFSLNAAALHVEATGLPDGYEYRDYSEDEDGRVEGVGMEEVFDVTYTLKNWVAPDGSLPGFGEIPLQTGEFVPSKVLNEIRPDDEWIHEATGNEGVTIEHAYRVAALVLWPRDNAARVLCQAGVDNLISHIAVRQARPSADRSEILALGRGLVEFWPLPPSFRQKEWAETCIKGVEQLVALDDRQTLARLLSEAIMANYSGWEGSAVIAGAKALGHHEIWRSLPEFVDSNIHRHFNEVTELVGRLFGVIGEASAGSEPDLFLAVARRVASRIPEALRNEGDQELSLEALCRAFGLLWDTDLQEEAEVLANHLVELPKSIDPHRNVPRALDTLSTSSGGAIRASGAFRVLWQSAAEHLNKRSGDPPVSPMDWRIPLTIKELERSSQTYHSSRFQYGGYYDESEDLDRLKAELVAFCNDARETTHMFAARQSLRSSLVKVITDYDLDLNCRTEETGRPYKLVCTKNRKSFNRRLEQYRGDIAAMQTLIENCPYESCEESRAELQRSVDRSSEAPTAAPD